MPQPADRDAPTTWLRLKMPYEFKGTSIETWLIELSGDGGVLRHVGFDGAGAVVYRCGPDEFGVWNDEVWIERYSPTSEAWSTLLRRDGGHISREQFETEWNRSRDIRRH